MIEEVDSPDPFETTRSRISVEVILLMALILATMYFGSVDRTDTFGWLQIPAMGLVILAMYLHFNSGRPRISSLLARTWIRAQILIVLALSMLAVAVRLGFPRESHADGPNTRMQIVLAGMVTLVCAYLIPTACLVPIVSRSVRHSSVYWLSLALALMLVGFTGIWIRVFPFL